MVKENGQEIFETKTVSVFNKYLQMKCTIFLKGILISLQITVIEYL